MFGKVYIVLLANYEWQRNSSTATKKCHFLMSSVHVQCSLKETHRLPSSKFPKLLLTPENTCTMYFTKVSEISSWTEENKFLISKFILFIVLRKLDKSFMIFQGFLSIFWEILKVVEYVQETQRSCRESKTSWRSGKVKLLEGQGQVGEFFWFRESGQWEN